MEIDKMYYRTHEAAKYLGLSDSELRRYAREGRIEFSRPGGKVMLFSKPDLDKFIEINRGK
jgi:excisionase family DNA binding protein